MACTFHRDVHGRNLAFVGNDLRTACRVNGFEGGVGFSSSPLQAFQLLTVAIRQTTPRWRGSMHLGVMACRPEELKRVPPSATMFGLDEELRQRGKDFWFLSSDRKLQVSVVHRNGETLNYGVNLSGRQLRKGDTVGLLFTTGGQLYFFLNDENQGLAAEGVPVDEAPGIHAVVDVWGSTQVVCLSGMPSLMEQCRRAVRQHLPTESEKALEVIDQLPISKSMQSFLKFCSSTINTSDAI